MEITLTQGLLIALVAFVAGIDFWLEAFFTFRPIIVSTLVGIILGDVRLGLIAGGLTELVFAGLTPAGGVQPPNPVLAGVMTPVLAHITGTDPTMAIGLALPFSFLMQYLILFYYSVFAFAMKGVDKAANEANPNAIAKISLVLTLIVAFSYVVVVFLSVYLAQDAMRNLVNLMPAWLVNGFSVAGGILPAVGFGMLLKILFRKENVAYFILGFLLMTYGQFQNLLPVALLGVALALINYFKGEPAVTKTNESNKEDYSDGI